MDQTRTEDWGRPSSINWIKRSLLQAHSYSYSHYITYITLHDMTWHDMTWWLVEAWSCLVHELRGTSWNFGLRRVASSRYKKKWFSSFCAYMLISRTLNLRFQAFAFKPSSVHSRTSSPAPWTWWVHAFALKFSLKRFGKSPAIFWA